MAPCRQEFPQPGQSLQVIKHPRHALHIMQEQNVCHQLVMLSNIELLIDLAAAGQRPVAVQGGMARPRDNRISGTDFGILMVTPGASYH